MIFYDRYGHTKLLLKPDRRGVAREGKACMAPSLIAGAAAADITPEGPQFLFGYPHVPRYSTGIHDPLLSSALFLADGATLALLLIANDVIYVSRQTAPAFGSASNGRRGFPRPT